MRVQAPAFRRPAVALLAALALASCTVNLAGQGGGGARRSSPPSLGTKPSPVAPATGSQGPASAKPLAEASPLPGGEARASGTVALHLPGRLGLALPASLVGAQAQASLSGRDGKVGLVGSQLLALADGRIVSNNSGSLISDHGGGLISDQGSGIVGNHSGAYQLAQADTAASEAPSAEGDMGMDPRMGLWLLLTMLDLNDQVLQAYLQAEPRLNAWKRFQVGKLRTLPTPLKPETFGPLVSNMLNQTENTTFAGHLSEEGGQARLRLVSLPAADSTLAQALPLMDVQASGNAGAAVARMRHLPVFEAALSMRSSASRVVVGPGPAGPMLALEVTERFKPKAERSALTGLLLSSLQQAARRRAELRPLGATQAHARMASSQLMQSSKAGSQPYRTDHLWLVGYHPSETEATGLAVLKRYASGPLRGVLPIFWVNPTRPGSEPARPVYLLPDGGFQSSASEALTRLTPSFTPADDAFLPLCPLPEDDLNLDAPLQPEPLSPELLAAPLQ